MCKEIINEVGAYVAKNICVMYLSILKEQHSLYLAFTVAILV